MSVLSLELPIDLRVSQEEFIGASWQWLKGMPYGDIDYKNYSPNEVPEEFQAHSQTQSIKLLKSPDDDGSIFGIQYLMHEGEGRRWTTELVSLKSSTHFGMSIKVTCDSEDPALRLPTPKKPYIIKTIMRNSWAGLDGDIKISDSYRGLDREHPEIVESLIYGDLKNILPVVYISAREDGKFSINPSYAAKQLGGMAHVFVEPDTVFSRKASRITNRETPYNGAIGLYWPDGIRKKIYLDHSLNSKSHDIVQSIYRDIISALANRRITPGCTWQSLMERVSQKKINKLIEQKSTEINEFITYVEQENFAKDQKMRQAEEEITRLKDEIKSIKKENSEKAKSSIFLGLDADYYDSERKSHVISFLREHIDKKPSEWRSRHIIESVISENQPYDNVDKDEIISKIREAIRGYKSMSKKTKSLLEAAGFSVDDGGKHYKLVWKEDGRYTFSLSKTPSDGRSDKNMISDICKKLFG